MEETSLSESENRRVNFILDMKNILKISPLLNIWFAFVILLKSRYLSITIQSLLLRISFIRNLLYRAGFTHWKCSELASW